MAEAVPPPSAALDDAALLDALAQGLHARRLTAPAMFMLEAWVPLEFASSQLMILLRPLVEAVWPAPLTWDRATRLLESRAAIAGLLRRLEELADGDR